MGTRLNKMFYINKLRKTIQYHFKWNKARIKFLTNFITSLIICSTVKLSRIALFINNEVKSESNYRGVQRFFQTFKMNYEEYARFVISHFPGNIRFYLVMDRTNWKFGKTNINILMLGIIYKKMCFPLYWMLLDKGGSSSQRERKELLQKAIDLLGKERIAALLGDREFIGVRWFQYLIEHGIEFHIRLPKLIKVGSVLRENRKPITHIFRYWKENVKVDYRKALDICGFKLYLSAMKSKKDYCIVVSSKDNINSLDKYQLRWTIENMFGAFKSRGFNFEDTHMINLEKIKKLIVLVSIVYIWCVFLGICCDQSIPIKLMKLGRKRKSIFKYGFEYLTSFIKKLLEGKIYNELEFNEVTKILSCT